MNFKTSYKAMRQLAVILAMFVAPFYCFALNYYWVGGSGNWSDHNTHWAKTSGGTMFHDQVPQSTDNVFFDANSFTAAGQTVTIDETIVYCNNMNWTGITNTPTITNTNNSNNKLYIYGSMTLATAMNFNFGAEVHFLSFQLGNTITMSGKTFLNIVYFEGNGGEWILQDEFNSNNYVIQSAGVLRTNNNTMTMSSYAMNPSGSNQIGLYLGSSTMNINNSYANFILPAKTSNITFDAGTSTINFGDINTTFYYGSINASNYTFHNANFYGDGSIGTSNIFNIINIYGTGNISNSNTINKATFYGTSNVSSNNTINKAIFHQTATVSSGNNFKNAKF